MKYYTRMFYSDSLKVLRVMSMCPHSFGTLLKLKLLASEDYVEPLNVIFSSRLILSISHLFFSYK